MVPRPQLTQRCRKEERGTDKLTDQLEEKLYFSLEEVPDHILKTENGPAVDTRKPKKARLSAHPGLSVQRCPLKIWSSLAPPGGFRTSRDQPTADFENKTNFKHIGNASLKHLLKI